MPLDFKIIKTTNVFSVPIEIKKGDQNIIEISEIKFNNKLNNILKEKDERIKEKERKLLLPYVKYTFKKLGILSQSEANAIKEFFEMNQDSKIWKDYDPRDPKETELGFTSMDLSTLYYDENGKKHTVYDDMLKRIEEKSKSKEPVKGIEMISNQECGITKFEGASQKANVCVAIVFKDEDIQKYRKSIEDKKEIYYPDKAKLIFYEQRAKAPVGSGFLFT